MNLIIIAFSIIIIFEIILLFILPEYYRRVSNQKFLYHVKFQNGEQQTLLLDHPIEKEFKILPELKSELEKRRESTPKVKK